MSEKRCDECGNCFEVDETKRNWQHVVMCSDECRRKRAATQSRKAYVKQEWPQELVCEWCNKKFLVHGPGGAGGGTGKRKYCTKDCYLDKKRDEAEREWQKRRKSKICLSCGKAFFPAKKAAGKQKYCSPICFRRTMREKHGNPRGTTTEFGRARRHVLKKYEGTCQLCGSKIKPEVHHYDGDRENNLIDNLTVLCRNCHTSSHRVMLVKVNEEWMVSGRIFKVLELDGSIKINT